MKIPQTVDSTLSPPSACWIGSATKFAARS